MGMMKMNLSFLRTLGASLVVTSFTMLRANYRS